MQKWGRVACICGGIGTAPLYPIVEALKETGNEVHTIIGARTKDLLILVDEMKKVSARVAITTDDGSLGFKGFVSQLLEKWITEDKMAFQHCFAIGPVPMMKATANVARKYNLPTTVSLNSIMVDGTGMCGGCRVTVGGRTKFCCVDGPEFDGLAVDYDELMLRLTSYREYENLARERHKCKIGLGRGN
jgi:ferredoxin--NADP+ reductase